MKLTVAFNKMYIRLRKELRNTKNVSVTMLLPLYSSFLGFLMSSIRYLCLAMKELGVTALLASPIRSDRGDRGFSCFPASDYTIGRPFALLSIFLSLVFFASFSSSVFLDLVISVS